MITVCVVAALFVSGCRRQASQAKLTQLLKQPGGIDKLNREVILMFNSTNIGKRFGTDQAHFNYADETTKFPLLRSMSRRYGVFLHYDSSDTPDYVSVPYGTHFDTRHYRFYHPTRTNKPADFSSLVHVVSNIYSTKRAK